MRTIFISLIIAAFVLGSCSREPDYFHKDYKLKDLVWKRFDILPTKITHWTNSG